MIKRNRIGYIISIWSYFLLTYQFNTIKDVLSYECVVETLKDLEKLVSDRDLACVKKNRFNVYIQFTCKYKKNSDKTTTLNFFKAIFNTYCKQSKYKNFQIAYKNDIIYDYHNPDSNPLDFIKNLYIASSSSSAHSQFFANKNKSYKFILDKTYNVDINQFIDLILKDDYHVVMLDNCLEDSDDFALLYKIHLKMQNRCYFSNDLRFYFFNLKFTYKRSEDWLKKIMEIQNTQTFSLSDYDCIIYDYITLKNLCLTDYSLYKNCAFGYSGIYQIKSANKIDKSENQLFAYCKKNHCKMGKHFSLCYRLVEFQINLKNCLNKSIYKNEIIHAFKLSNLYASYEFVIHAVQKNSYTGCNIRPKEQIIIISLYFIFGNQKKLYNRFYYFVEINKKKVSVSKKNLDSNYKNDILNKQKFFKKFICNLTKVINIRFNELTDFLPSKKYFLEYIDIPICSSQLSACIKSNTIKNKIDVFKEYMFFYNTVLIFNDIKIKFFEAEFKLHKKISMLKTRKFFLSSHCQITNRIYDSANIVRDYNNYSSIIIYLYKKNRTHDENICIVLPIKDEVVANAINYTRMLYSMFETQYNVQLSLAYKNVDLQTFLTIVAYSLLLQKQKFYNGFIFTGRMINISIKWSNYYLIKYIYKLKFNSYMLLAENEKIGKWANSLENDDQLINSPIYDDLFFFYGLKNEFIYLSINLAAVYLYILKLSMEKIHEIIKKNETYFFFIQPGNNSLSFYNQLQDMFNKPCDCL